MVSVPWGTERGMAQSDKSEQSEQRDYGSQWESRARGDIGIESVYARQVLERDRDKGRGKRTSARRKEARKDRGASKEGGREERERGKGRARVRWRGANQTVHFANSPTFWFAAMKRHYLQRGLW